MNSNTLSEVLLSCGYYALLYDVFSSVNFLQRFLQHWFLHTGELMLPYPYLLFNRPQIGVNSGQFTQNENKIGSAKMFLWDFSPEPALNKL